MSKDYKHMKSTKNVESNNNPDQLKSFLAGLMIGLCVAVIVYFYQHDFSQQTRTIQPKVTIENPKPIPNKINDPPPPSFDFYQILPNMEVNVSEWEAGQSEDMEEHAEPSAEKPGIYILQIGSFKQYDTANEVKTKLALMGIEADIQRVVINGKDIRHRVRVGPYRDSEKLLMVRQQLIKNNLNYMLLRLKSGNE